MANEGETLQLTNVESQRTAKVRVLDRQPMDADTSEIIERLTVALKSPGSEQEKIVSLVVKRINNLLRSKQEKENKVPLADVWIDRWKLLKEAGIPVVPMARRVANEKVAMTDLTADGSVVYGKADMTAKRRPRPLDHLLLSVDLKELEKQVGWIVARADEKEIAMAPDDALALVVHPDGSWQPIALDIGLTERKEDFEKRYYPGYAKNWNTLHCTDLVGYISALQQKLR